MAKRTKKKKRSTRGTLYSIAKLLGDLNAIFTGRIGRRILRRSAGRAVSKSLFKW